MEKNLNKGGAQLYVLLMLVLILAGSFYIATRDENKTFLEQVWPSYFASTTNKLTK